MTVELLTEQHLEFLSLKGGCTGWPESTLVKMPHCLKSHVAAYLFECIWYICSYFSNVPIINCVVNEKCQILSC